MQEGTESPLYIQSVVFMEYNRGEGFPVIFTFSKDLGYPVPFLQAHQQAAGLEVEQRGLKLAPV